MTQHEIQLLYDFDAWADLKLLEVISLLNKDIYMKDLGASFGSIHGTLVHILSADRIWLARWMGKTGVPLKAEDVPSVDVFKKQLDAFQCEMNNFVRGLTDETLNNLLSYTDFKGNGASYPLWQQMQHKVNHSTYHRGQVVTMVRQTGGTVVNTDLMNYIKLKETRG
jgi:uncharacterized damage-inducible protein DinB